MGLGRRRCRALQAVACAAACASAADAPVVGACLVTKSAPASHLREWLAWHAIQGPDLRETRNTCGETGPSTNPGSDLNRAGVRQFYLYDNNSAEARPTVLASARAVFESQVWEPTVDVHVVPWHAGEALNIRPQLEAYADCLRAALADEVPWLLAIDDDEHLAVAASKQGGFQTLPDWLSNPEMAASAVVSVAWVYPQTLGRWWASAFRILGHESRFCPHTKTGLGKPLLRTACAEGWLGPHLFVVKPGCGASLTIEESAAKGLSLLHFHFSSVEEWVQYRVERVFLRDYDGQVSPSTFASDDHDGVLGLPLHLELCHPLGLPDRPAARGRSPADAAKLGAALARAQPELHRRLGVEEHCSNESAALKAPDELEMDAGGANYKPYAALKARLASNDELDAPAYLDRYVATTPETRSLAGFLAAESARAAAFYHLVVSGVDRGAQDNNAVWRRRTAPKPGE
ncbi:hypothetical protein M885DRAFT_500063 [Pelagophyceae sp. CCMP2097]|nr:hypothetical protein M885DRAFT_500063 [Pelagophyceae sp. CCMP2097]